MKANTIREFKILQARHKTAKDYDANARRMIREVLQEAGSAGTLEILRAHIDRLHARMVRLDAGINDETTAAHAAIHAVAQYADESAPELN